MLRLFSIVPAALKLMLRGLLHYTKPIKRDATPATGFRRIGSFVFWLFTSWGVGAVAYMLFKTPNAFILFGLAWFVLGFFLDWGRRRGNGVSGLLMVLALAATVALTSTGAAKASFCYSSQSNWYGGSTTSPTWCEPVYYPPSGGCHSINVWHTGRNSFGVVDYKFHLYVSWCSHRQPNGQYHWDSISWHTGLTNLGSTANYQGITGHSATYSTCRVGEVLYKNPYQSNGCLKLIYHAQVAHSVPGLPFSSWPIGHPTVSVFINVDGNPMQGGYMPYWNDDQY